MDEIEMIRKISTLMFTYRRKTQYKKVRLRDMMVLDAIVRKDNWIKISDLSELFSITKAAVSQEVKHLEDMGWVQRSKCETDKRTTYICVSELGKETLFFHQKKLRNKSIEFMKFIGEDDAKALERILEKGIEFQKRVDEEC